MKVRNASSSPSGTAEPAVIFVQGPSRLPAPPKGDAGVVVLDVAFASGDHFERVTEPFIQALGSRLLLWCDHHEHPQGWARYQSDPRFLLVPNRLAHACPELITPETARRVGKPGSLFVHADLDGVLTAAKLLRGGVEAWPGADEDARAVDSPGRGHALSDRGEKLALAIDEALAVFTAGERRDFLKALVFGLAAGDLPAELADQVERSAERSLEAVKAAAELASSCGRAELGGLFVIRVAGRRKGRERKALLRCAEERAKIGVVVEEDAASGHAWLTAATFDEEADLGDIPGLEGGRSDFRGAESSVGAKVFAEILQRLSVLARR